MCACMYTCVTCEYECECLGVYKSVSVWIYNCICECFCVHIEVCLYICMNMCVFMPMGAQMSVCVFMWSF